MKRYNDFIKKTALHNEYREECNRKAEYYKLWNNHTSKYTEWTAPKYYENRIQKEQIQREKEQKRVALALRRQELAEKLRAETIEHSKELNKLKEQKVYSLDDLRQRHHEIQEKLEADRKSEAEIQLYHLWRRDEPSVRQAESEFRRGCAHKAWAQQVEAKRSAELAAQEASAKLHEEQRLAALREEEQAELAEKKKREEERKMAQINAEEAQQILRANIKAAEELRKEELAAARLEQELFILEQERMQYEKRKSQSAWRLGLERQAAFRLRHRASEIQQELEEDKEFLRRVQLAVEQEASEKAERRHACIELANALRVVTEHAKREASLARLNANMFHEEAVVQLRLQEERWQLEKSARRRLLASILAEQKSQARVTREKASQQRKRLQEESEELRHITENFRRTQLEMARMKSEQQQNYLSHLDQQILEKESKKQEEKEIKRREEAENRRKAAEEAARLDAELKKIMLGRQRVAWL